MASKKSVMYVLMGVLVTAWGFEYVVVKYALETLAPLTLMFFKYLLGSLVVLGLHLALSGRPLVRRKDIPVFVACAVFGDIGYFFFEYTAMDFLPISLITIILAFVPVVSLVVERILYRRRITRTMVVGSLFCILGVSLVIGADLRLLLSGRLIGYLLAFGAVTCWNAYNFMTASLHDRYDSLTLTFYQQLFSILLLWPYALSHLPEPAAWTGPVLWGVLYLGVVSGAIGFLIQVRALHIIGVTPTAMFSNFMPVTSTFFGWLVLGETIAPVQYLGGAIILAAAAVVIREKQKGTDHD